MDFCTVEQNLLLLVVNIALTSAASHSLQYISTGVTPGINSPEFTVVGLVDGEQFEYYDSNISEVIPKTEWIKKIDADDPKYWNKSKEIAQGNQEIFKFNIATLMQRFNHTEGVHTVQWMVGCELHDDGTSTGYRQHGYDGEDFISLDLNTLTWTAANQKAVITKQKLEGTPAAVWNKAYLQTECIEYLKKYVDYSRSSLERKVSPEVSLFQKDSSSPVVCHATESCQMEDQLVSSLVQLELFCSSSLLCVLEFLSGRRSSLVSDPFQETPVQLLRKTLHPKLLMYYSLHADLTESVMETY
ncbi:hypothetical protein MHYP_G00262220 [Metynnis hypsauchen]